MAAGITQAASNYEDATVTDAGWLGGEMSQREQILSHLKRRPITPIDALNKYGCFRLAARIQELRDSGHRIETTIVEQGEKRYAQYWLK